MTQRQPDKPKPVSSIPTSADTPPQAGLGRREGLPPGTLKRPHFGRQGDEQRDPSAADLANTGRVQRSGWASPTADAAHQERHSVGPEDEDRSGPEAPE
jgi:hypothetical protein